MKIHLFKILSLLMSLTLLSTVGKAQDVVDPAVGSIIAKPRALESESELKPHLGLLLGLSNPEGAYSSGAELGLTMGYQFYIPYSLGFELSTVGNEASSDSAELRRTKALAQLTYNFAGNIPVISKSYVGLGMGPMLESFRGDDDFVWGVMPVVGFDIPLMSGKIENVFSLGANARYLISSSGLPNVFSTNVAAKYWF
jgi:hypothetical protein